MRLYIEEYIAISIAGLLKLYALDFDNWFETVSSIFGIILILSAVVAPIIIWRVLYTKHEKDEVWSDEFVEKYGALHEGIQQRDKGALLFHVVFMIRRLTLALAIVAAANHNFYQTMINLYLASGILIF